MGAYCGRHQRYLIWWDVFDALKPSKTKFFCRTTRTFYRIRNWPRKWSHRLYCRISRDHFWVDNSQASVLDAWSIVAGVDVDSSQAVNYFHHTSGGRKRGLFLLKKRSKAGRTRQIFFKVLRPFYKEKYPAISEHSCWSIDLEESPIGQDGFTLSFSMKRSWRDWQSSTSDLWLYLRNSGSYRSFARGNFGWIAIFEMDLASGWSRWRFPLNFQICFISRWAYFQPEGAYFSGAVVIIEAVRAMGFGFALYMIFLDYWQKASQNFLIMRSQQVFMAMGMIFSWGGGKFAFFFFFFFSFPCYIPGMLLAILDSLLGWLGHDSLPLPLQQREVFS